MSRLTKILFNEYNQRLINVLSEINVVDDQGNIIISKDLKVRHKDSGYEYTVEDVIDSDDGIKIALRDPEEPRVDSAGEEGMINEDPENLSLDGDSGEENYDGENIFIVDEEEFEKEFEVE
jgi:hypothetical protein